MDIGEIFIDLLFVGCGLIAIVMSLLVVLRRNPLYSSLFLVASFIPIAIIYVMLYATFIGIIQVLVYAGAIMVLFTFVIMMIDLKKEEYSHQMSKKHRAISLISIILFLIFIGQIFIFGKLNMEQYSKPPKALGDFGTINRIGKLIFEEGLDKNIYVFSFEMTSFLILLAIVGVIILGKRRLDM